MNYTFFEPNTYLLLYLNKYYENENELIDNIYNKFNIKIIKILNNDDIKKNINHSNFLEIFIDNQIENDLIKNAFIILYFSNYKKTKNLCNLIKLYNKNIIYNIKNINDNINENINENIDIQNNIELFEKYYNSLNENVNNIEINKNIDITYKKINNNIINDKIHIITFFKNDESIYKILQKKCIMENINNNHVSHVHIFGMNLTNEFSSCIDVISNSKNLILNETCLNISFKDLFDYCNEKLLNKIICILRSDIILPNQNNLDDIDFYLTLNENDIFILSRLERLVNGNLARTEKLNKILYSSEQDAWIFKSPIKIDNLDNNIIFYDKYSELYLNKILYNNGYNIINDTNKYKIIRILYDNNIDNRLLINKKDIIKDSSNIYLLPDNIHLNNIDINMLLSIINIDDKELYNLKCYIFNKYLKKKIVNEI
jgi:hypothetical protein